MKLINEYTANKLKYSRNCSHLMTKMCTLLMLIYMGMEDGKCQSMEWLSRPGEYKSVEYAGNDIFRVQNQHGKWGLLHSDGRLILDVVYDSITPFNEERSLLIDRPSKRLLGILDSKGDFVKDFSADNIYVSRFPRYKEGRLAFSRGDGKFGYLNEIGGVAIEPRFYFAGPFEEGIAAVQYDNTEYGLISKDGRSAIISDDRFYFMSTPVDWKVLAIKGSRKGGDQLVLMRIDGSSLKKEKVLEDGMNITIPDDFTSLECQLGHSYYLDDQWRVKSASYPAPLPQVWEETSGLILEDNSELSGKQTENGMKITYHDRPIAGNQFRKVSTYDKSYAVVQTTDGKNGILRLNPTADIKIFANDEPVIFHHNEDKEVEYNVTLKNLNPSKLNIKRMDGDSTKECALEQIDGEWKLKIPYFMASDKYDEEQTGMIMLDVEYDGLSWREIVSEIKSMHKPGYTVTLTGSGTTNENGNGTLTLHIKAINGKNAQGTVSVNGGKPISFNKGSKAIPMNISIPEGSSKTFKYTVKVQEDGCPEYTAVVSKNVSNPVKKSEEPKDNGKKKIIIQ